MIDYLEELNIDLDKFYLEDSWGVVLGFGDYTKKHHHCTLTSSFLSGVIYLHDHPQKLYFPEINQEIIPQKGRFVFFSSYLLHYTNRNIQKTKKYALSFNFSGTRVST